MKKIVVTGGRGFIGSHIVKSVFERGYEVIVVDQENIRTPYLDVLPHTFLDKDVFLQCILDEDFMRTLECIIHLGACSSTVEKNRDFLQRNNTEYSQMIAYQCARTGIRFFYASSAATYGNGSRGYSDKERSLAPLNEYGKSKYLFDEWLLNEFQRPPQWVGFKFFNVYGPHEEHKGEQASVPYRKYREVRERGYLELFKSCNPGYRDGGQLRDFVYIQDVVDVIFYFLDNPRISGIFNVGTGKARSFDDLAKALFLAMELPVDIRYIEMPTALQAHYQYFTQADLSSLFAAGYTAPFRDIEKGVSDYVHYLTAAHS